ncbi:MAG: hypothetical protein CMN32_08795 [Saprospirales bacterium]|nr:hypothetical protein [Saprospirales bacterium]
MNRRDAIKRTAILMGGTISASAMLGILNGCTADPVPADGWTPAFFSAEEGEIVKQMAERIFPKTDTPGAIDAGVHGFIDTMMAEFYQEPEKKMFREGVQRVEADAKSEYGKSFVALKPDQMDALLTKYDEEAFGENRQDGPHFWRMMKELTTLGFFTSEVGATEVLKYDPVPGDYKGCIPFEEVGVAWATS